MVTPQEAQKYFTEEKPKISYMVGAAVVAIGSALSMFDPFSWIALTIFIISIVVCA